MSNDQYKQALITAIRAGDAERDRAFKFFEERTAASFKGDGGAKFFRDLLAIVQEADPKAVTPYIERFLPLLDDEAGKKVILEEFAAALPEVVKAREKEVRLKEVLANFLEGASNNEGVERSVFIAHYLEQIDPQQRVFLVESLFNLVRSKST